MTLPEGTSPLHGPQGLGGVPSDRPASPAAAGDPTAFRRLLEQLEALAKPGGPGPDPVDGPADLGALQEALGEADREYEQVMDLRRRLEEAFRRSAGG